MTSGRLEPAIDNWPEVAHAAAQRLRTESLAQGGVDELERAADVSSAGAAPQPSSQLPVVPTRYRLGASCLGLFATLMQFGTPDDVTVDEIEIELYCPADEASAQLLRAMGADRA